MKCADQFQPERYAIVLDEALKQNLAANAVKDSSASIKLVYNDNDIIEYRSSSKNPEFAVFSEVYYDAGWVATIDGKESPIIRTNYVLRGLQVPAGDHKIVFEFKPASFINSNTRSDRRFGSDLVIIDRCGGKQPAQAKRTGLMGQPSVLGIVSYKVFPAQMGGQKCAAEWYAHLRKQNLRTGCFKRE
jgi:hypothetical protein